MFIIFITILLSLSFTINATVEGTIATSQASVSSYSVKVGDSNTYVITEANGSNFELTLANNTKITIAKGDQFLIKVIATIQNSNDLENIYINETLSIPGKENINLGTQFGSNYIQPAFADLTSAESYYKSNSTFEGFVVNKTKNNQRNMIYLYSYEKINFTQTLNVTQEWNWKTGWLESLSISSAFTNGTNSSVYQLQRKRLDLINTILADSNYFVGLSIITICLVVVILVGFNYSKYRSQISKEKNYTSFFEYLRKNLKFWNSKQKQTQRYKHDSDKALEMIEEILNETKEK